MTDEHLEREDKYDVPADYVVPTLTDLPSVETVEVASHQLEATYFDTEDSDLRRHRVTVRKRRGGTDPGWHLKLPAEAGRIEIRVKSLAASVPRELSALILGVRRGRPLTPTVTISTQRDSHVLTDAEGNPVAEVADDHVQAAAADGSTTVADWREIEVELGPAGDEALLSAIGRRLVAAGATRSSSVSKSARALGEAPPSAPRHERLAGLVDGYLQTQYDAVLAGDLALRRGLNAVHPTRVAVRRLRSTTRTFDALFDRDARESLEAELVWIAAILGEVRDLDIVGDRLTSRLEALPGDFVIGPVAQRIESSVGSERAAAYRRLRKAMNGRRYLALLSLIDQWRVDPPYTDAAGKSRKTAAPFVAKAEKTMLKRLRRAIPDGAEDSVLHRARKAEKRYRYACELAEPILGKHTEQAIAKAKALQKLLGEFQDSVVSAALLRRLAMHAAGESGEDGFTYGLLLAQEWEVQRMLRAEVAGGY